MSSPSDTIIITDDEELPSLEAVSPRPSYREFESMVLKAVDNEVDAILSRKRKRTETESSALNNAFEELGKEVSRTSHRLKWLEEENLRLRDELHQERENHKKTQEELSQQKEKHVVDCKICYMQPDLWVMIPACGHMVCESCAGRLQTPKRCPICRASFKGYLPCYPFAG
ncbi:hypothetical protein V6Z79_010276 [Aspergillus fumigatus]